MPFWIARRAAPAIWRRIPWRMAWAVAVWLGSKGRERVQANLTQKEQHEFWDLLKRSRGRPGALSTGDRMRMRSIAGKAIRGD